MGIEPIGPIWAARWTGAIVNVASGAWPCPQLLLQVVRHLVYHGLLKRHDVVLFASSLAHAAAKQFALQRTFLCLSPCRGMHTCIGAARPSAPFI